MTKPEIDVEPAAKPSQWGAPEVQRDEKKSSLSRVVPAIVAVVAVVAVGVFALVQSRSGSGKRANAQGTTQPPVNTASNPPHPSTAPPTTIDPKPAAILSVYLAEEATYLDVATHYPLAPTDPRLPQVFTGKQLIYVQHQLTTAMLVDQYGSGTAEHAPVVMSIDGNTAVINDCVFDHTAILNGRTHQTVTPAAKERALVTVHMELVSGTWKVANYQKVSTGCAPSV